MSKFNSYKKRNSGKKIKKRLHPFDGIKEINIKFKKLKNRLFLPKFMREMKRLRIGGLSGGNRLKLLTDGDSCFNEIIKALRSARSSINLETYIFNSDDIGWKIARLLVNKVKSGLEVNVIYDAVGCLKTSPAIMNLMREGGVELVEYHPFLPWRRFWNISHRDHRKIIVVDGKTAFIGGINIGNQFAGKKFNGKDWRDTHLMIEGPAVRDIQLLFMESWYKYGGAVIDTSSHFQNLREIDKKLVMILSSKSRRKIPPIKESYLSAIKFARHFIYITNAYFIPDPRIYRALIRAVRRGVDVRLLLPEKSEVPIVQYASRYLYKRYLKHGISVYEYTKTVLHAKTAVVDGIWSTVGSSNIDRRSFRKNLEINAIVLDQEFGRKMVYDFHKDLRNSVELKLDRWEKRSIIHFIIEWFFYRFRNFL